MLKLQNYHKSLDVLHYNCEEPRAYFIPFESENATLSEHRETSAFFKSLNGTWDFKWYPSVYEVEGISVPEMPENADKLDVPMSWHLYDNNLSYRSKLTFHFSPTSKTEGK